MEETNQQKILDISWATIIRIVAALAFLYLVYLLKDLLIWFLFALIISILFNPPIDFLRRFHVPRVIGAIFVYVSVFAIFGYLIYAVAPLLFSELQEFSLNFPQYFDKAIPYFSALKIEAFKSFDNFTATLEKALIRASTNIFTAFSTIFGGILSTLSIFTIAFFLSLEERGIERTIALIAPKNYKKKALQVWKHAQRKISLWFGTRIIGCLFVGISTAVICYVLNVRYFVFFGLLAGVSDIIVTIGPLLSGTLIAIFIALVSVPKALIFVIAYVLVQQIEGQILLPLLSKKFLKLPPALVLMSILAGSKLWGLLGAILSIPLVGMIYEVVKGFFKRKELTVSDE